MIDFASQRKNRDLSRDAKGKRRRTPEEFRDLCVKAGDSCMMIKIYNHKEKTVIEALKNSRTKQTHIMKLRRPTAAEETEYGKLVMQNNIVSGKQVREQVEIVAGEYKKDAVIEINTEAPTEIHIIGQTPLPPTGAGNDTNT